MLLRLRFDAFLGEKAKNCNLEQGTYPEVFLGKDVLKICSRFTGEHSCQSVIPIKLQSNFIEITLPYGCSPVNLRDIFILRRTGDQIR